MNGGEYTDQGVDAMVKEWVKRLRANAKRNGEAPVYMSRLPEWERKGLYAEAHLWHRLATGIVLEQCVPPRPSAENVAAIRDHLAQCCEQLRTTATARGDALPEGLWDQLETAERRIAMALDVVEHAPAEWSREADAAWAELMRWASSLDPGRNGFASRWEPDGTTTYGNLI